MKSITELKRLVSDNQQLLNSIKDDPTSIALLDQIENNNNQLGKLINSLDRSNSPRVIPVLGNLVVR